MRVDIISLKWSSYATISKNKHIKMDHQVECKYTTQVMLWYLPITYFVQNHHNVNENILMDIDANPNKYWKITMIFEYFREIV